MPAAWLCLMWSLWGSLGLKCVAERASLLGDQESVLPHALHSGFLPLRFTFLPRLLFRLLVHGLTDGFGTMFWQQLCRRAIGKTFLKSTSNQNSRFLMLIPALITRGSRIPNKKKGNDPCFFSSGRCKLRLNLGWFNVPGCIFPADSINYLTCCDFPTCVLITDH